jgi:hypothetical protein
MSEQGPRHAQWQVWIIHVRMMDSEKIQRTCTRLSTLAKPNRKHLRQQVTTHSVISLPQTTQTLCLPVTLWQAQWGMEWELNQRHRHCGFGFQDTQVACKKVGRVPHDPRRKACRKSEWGWDRGAEWAGGKAENPPEIRGMRVNRVRDRQQSAKSGCGEDGRGGGTQTYCCRRRKGRPRGS